MQVAKRQENSGRGLERKGGDFWDHVKFSGAVVPLVADHLQQRPTKHRAKNCTPVLAHAGS